MFKTLANWRSNRQVLRELAKLSDRDLADLGIARSEIKDVVRRSVELAAK